MSESSKKLAVIDGKSVFYRGYYAMPNLATKEGVPTGGVFGFATMALELIKKLQPDYVAVAWDKPKTNIRRRLEMYPEYKAGRKPAPPDFYTQIPILHDLLEAFGWPLYELDDYEADDIMGTLAVQAEKKGIETLLITSDLDMLQLVNHKVKVYALKRGFSNIEEFHPESFEQKYGIKATQFLDLKALKGDSSDNIPGVPGVGEKTAITLLQKYETLENIYKHLPDIKETVRKKLEAGKDLAFLSKKIAAIWCDAPLPLDLAAMDGTKIDTAALAKLLRDLEFRTLLRNLPENMQAEIPATDQIQGVKLNVPKNLLIDSNDKLAKLEFKKPKTIFLHTRAAGRQGADPTVLIVGSESTAYTLDLTKLDKKAVVNTLKPILADEKTGFVGHDIKSDLKLLRTLALDIKNIEHDTLMGAFLINPLIRAQSITDLAVSTIGYEGASFEDLPNDDFMSRGGEFVAVIRELYDNQMKSLKDLSKVAELAKTIEWPLVPVLADMEMTGIKLDTEYLAKFSKELEGSLSDIEQKIYGHAGVEFNIGSPGQLAEVLFENLKLPTTSSALAAYLDRVQGEAEQRTKTDKSSVEGAAEGSTQQSAKSSDGVSGSAGKQVDAVRGQWSTKKGKTGYSTAATELDKLRGAHPIIDLITQYREAAKLKNTYVDTLPKLVDKNSRVHTTFNTAIAPTGRLSSADPNLQNIPVRTDLGRRIRTAFVAGKGNLLVSADYSQFELRLGAVIANDPNMIKAFKNDADIHAETAAQIYGIDAKDVTKAQRSSVKEVNFGILYGLGPHALSQSTGMSFGEAREFIAKYFEIRPRLKDYIETTKKMALEQGYVETLLGRRRPTPDAQSSNFMVREGALRAAINMPLQGSAADIMKMAMIEVAKKLPDGSKILLQIHDSLIIETPEKGAEAIGELVKQTMETTYTKLPIKLKADVSIGKNWGEL